MCFLFFFCLVLRELHFECCSKFPFWKNPLVISLHSHFKLKLFFLTLCPVFARILLNVWTSEGIGKVTSVHPMHFLTGMPAGCMHFSVLCSWLILVLSVLLLILDFSRDTAVGFATTLSLPVLGRLREQVVPNTVTRFLFYAMQKLNFEKGKTTREL